MTKQYARVELPLAPPAGGPLLAVLTGEGWQVSFPEDLEFALRAAKIFNEVAPLEWRGWHPQPWAEAVESLVERYKGKVVFMAPSRPGKPGTIY